MPTPSMTDSRLMIVSAAAALLISTAWHPPCAAQVATRPRPQSPAVVDSANPPDSVLRAYLLSLSFLSDHVSSDERMLDAAHTNVIVRIEPAVGNYLVREQLRTRGRVLARLVNLGTDSVSRFALAPRGKTYFWVQYVGDVLKGVLISTDSTGNIVRRAPVRVSPDSIDHARAMQSLARWRTDGMAKVLAPCAPYCPPFSWCRGDSLRTDVVW